MKTANKLSAKKPMDSSKKSAKAVAVHRSFRLSKQTKTTEIPLKKSNTKFFLTLGSLFLIAAALIGYQPFMRYWQGRNVPNAPAPAPVRTAAVETATQTNKAIAGKPTRLVIPSLGIDLQIADGIYNSRSQTWTLSRDKAHYALMTPEPNNQSGNTFIYGHNRPEVFSRLSKLAIGQDVVIYTDNHHVFTYKYRSSYETNPNDDTLFSYKGAPILTLQTCSGLWYQNRFLMTFDLIEVA